MSDALSGWNEGVSDEANTTFRGGGLPDKHRGFYTTGKKYRTRQYLASSFKKSVAETFAKDYRTPRDAEPIIWTIRFDGVVGCKHVNYLERETSVRGESEFLLPPYSVLTVEAVAWNTPHATLGHYHSVTLRAASDNWGQEDLPTAPWS
jgi:hypothetical protein